MSYFNNNTNNITITNIEMAREVVQTATDVEWCCIYDPVSGESLDLEDPRRIALIQHLTQCAESGVFDAFGKQLLEETTVQLVGYYQCCIADMEMDEELLEFCQQQAAKFEAFYLEIC